METIGKILANARERKGISIQDLANTTKIVSRFIVALEDERFEELPGDVYVKGFLRNISDKLGLNSSDVLEIYNLQKSGMLYAPVESLLKNRTKSIKVEKKDLKIDDSEALDKDVVNDDAISNNKTSDKINLKDNNKTSSEIDAAEQLRGKNQKIKLDKIKERSIEYALKETSKVTSANSSLYSAEQALLVVSRQDLPVFRKRRGFRRRFLLLGLFSLVIILVGLFYIFKDNLNIALPKFGGDNSEIKNDNASVQRSIVDTLAKQNVKEEDIIYFKPLGISATIKFVNIGNIVKGDINGDEFSLSKSSPVIHDLNGNGIDDFRMSLIEVYEDLATVEIERLIENNVVTNTNAGPLANDVNNTNNTIIQNVADNNFGIEMVGDVMYLYRDIEKTSISVDMTAKGFVYVRYFIDSERPATTNLLSGKSLKLKGEDVIMLTLGDAGEIVVNVNGKPVVLGLPGDTVNKTIKWVKNLDDSTKYSLTISDTK